jgi:FMN phosphatase YigB (HAD superfamily)
MEDEKNEFVKMFRMNFQKYTKVKMVLYGLSIYSNYILEECNEFKIVGLMDGYKNEGILYGKRILSKEEVVEKDVKIIVIIARSNSSKIIFRRIASFCEENQIFLFDVYGQDLLNKKQNINEDLTQLVEEDLKKKIDAHDVISFDIFDTLLMRSVLYPQDVFCLVNTICELDDIQKDYYIYKRIEAERELNKERVPTLDDIYTYIQESTNYSEEECNQLKQAELELENKVLVSREAMVKLFDYAVLQKKKVYLVSDMYLSKDQISTILERFKIKGYIDILVSCEYGTTKQQKLFQRMKEIAMGENYLHIGDSKEADILAAEKNGIHAYQIMSAIDMLEQSDFKELLNQNDTFEMHLIVGIIISKIFNNPFIRLDDSGRMIIERGYDISYQFIGPIISVFVLWFINKIKESDFNKIIFGARDGFLIQKLYEIGIEELGLNNMPKGTYFYISRMSGIISTIFTEQDILYAAKMSFDGTPEMLLQHRFFLEYDEILPFSPLKYNNVEEYILKHEKKIKKTAKKVRNNYYKYINKNKMNDKMIFFDFVSSGTCQMCLEKLLHKKLYGYYFIRLAERYVQKEKLNIKTLVEGSNAFEIKRNIFDNYVLIENIISALEPSLKLFDNDGNPIFVEDKRTEKEKKFILESQEAIKDYFLYFIKLTKGRVDINAFLDIADYVLKFLNNSYINLQSLNIEECLIADEFCRREVKFNNLL